ncbi:MAG: EAL domain-containing protein [Enterobacteriaceae bacterium]|nr:EAL domain-containing protein [Enterobacteriaceae bacterium]
MNIFDDQYAPAPASDTHRIMKQTVTLVLMLMSFIFLTTIFALIQTENDLARNTRHQTRQLLMKALDNRQENLRLHLADNAAWNEAWDNLHRKVDISWAWDEQNLGKSLFAKFGYEGVFVLSPKEETRYSVIDGNLHLVPFEEWLGKNLNTELSTALKVSNGTAISRVIFANNELVLISAAWITTEDKIELAKAPQDHSIMIFVDKLTPKKLAAMGEEYAIADLHSLASKPTRRQPHTAGMSWPVSEGDVYFEWNNKNPGDTLLTWVLPLLVLLMLTSVLLALSLVRKGLLKARLNDEKTFLLEQSRRAFAISERRFRDVVETTTDWIWEADELLQLTWISVRFPAITGHRIDDWIGRSLRAFLAQENPALTKWLDLPYAGNFLTLNHCSYFSAQGNQRYCNLTLKRVTLIDGSLGFRGTATDVTLEVEASERIQYLSHHDELTGLPNRVRMKEFLEGRLQSDNGAENALAMISVDLNDFKTINDVYGHTVGDQVLSEASNRLRRCMRSIDLVTRQGGDEFIIIASDLSRREDIERFCSRIVEELNHPFDICGNEIVIGVSMGIALAPQDALNASDLLRYSDIALYKAKNDPDAHWVFYKPDMAEQIVQRRELEQELREAIKHNQLFLLYQPRYDITLQKITSLEALVRWQHPTHGLFMPDQFIPLAEETGIIIALTDWVLTTACREVKAKSADLSLSVNISPVEFKASDIVCRVKSILAKTGFDPSRLELEVTENATLSKPETTLKIMQQLKSFGVKLLMDDFGTGYASLNYLRSFPFDGIKLDKSFIMAMGDSESAKNIVEKIIGLGKDFNLEVTAEGVETFSQLQQLEEFECDIAQGYFISHPTTLDEIELKPNFKKKKIIIAEEEF